MTLAAICAVQWLGAADAAAAQLAIVAAMPPSADRPATLTVDVRATKPVPPESFSVTVAGAKTQARAVPVFSDRLSLGLVVDASDAGTNGLPAALSGATNLILQVPSTTRTAVVADSSPPTVAAGLRQGATEALPALSRIQSGGARRTSDAVNLVLQQLAPVPGDPRVVVLYTGAPDAGGTTAGDLAARLHRANTLLAVVTTATETGYWQTVTRATGGILAAAHAITAIEAFGEVADILRARYLITFPAPKRLPAPVSVTVATAEGTLTADTLLPAADQAGGSIARTLLVVGALLTLAVAIVAVVIAARRPKPRSVAPQAIARGGAAAPPGARGPAPEPRGPAPEPREPEPVSPVSPHGWPVMLMSQVQASPDGPPRESDESGSGPSGDGPAETQQLPATYGDVLGAAFAAAGERARIVGVAARMAATQSGAMPLGVPGAPQPDDPDAPAPEVDEPAPDDLAAHRSANES